MGLPEVPPPALTKVRITLSTLVFGDLISQSKWQKEYKGREFIFPKLVTRIELIPEAGIKSIANK